MARVTIKPTEILDPMFYKGTTVTNEFLPRDPTKALVDVKEILYDRVATLRSCLSDVVVPGWQPDDVERQMLNELDFIEGLLDKMEKSL